MDTCQKAHNWKGFIQESTHGIKGLILEMTPQGLTKEASRDIKGLDVMLCTVRTSGYEINHNEISHTVKDCIV